MSAHVRPGEQVAKCTACRGQGLRRTGYAYGRCLVCRGERVIFVTPLVAGVQSQQPNRGGKEVKKMQKVMVFALGVLSLGALACVGGDGDIKHDPARGIMPAEYDAAPAAVLVEGGANAAEVQAADVVPGVADVRMLDVGAAVDAQLADTASGAADVRAQDAGAVSPDVSPAVKTYVIKGVSLPECQMHTDASDWTGNYNCGKGGTDYDSCWAVVDGATNYPDVLPCYYARWQYVYVSACGGCPR